MRKPFFPLIRQMYSYSFGKAFPLDISRNRKMKKVIKFIQGLQWSKKTQAELPSNLKCRHPSKTDSCMALTHWRLTEGLGATSEVGPPTQSHEEWISQCYHALLLQQNKELTEQITKKNSYSFSKKRQSCPIHFVSIKQGQPICPMQSKWREEKHLIFSSSIRKTSAIRFQNFMAFFTFGCSSLHYFTRKTRLF